MAQDGRRWRFPAHRPAAIDRRYKTVKTIATILSSLMVFSAGAASPTGPVRTVSSSTGQFIVRGPSISPVGTNSQGAEAGLIELSPDILAISGERIKQALLRELTLGDLWRGRISLEISPVLSTNQAPIIVAKPFTDGWQYQMELPRWIETPKLLRGLVQVLLLEIANRNAGLRSAEVPLWLSEGMSQHLIRSSEVDLILSQPQWNFNRVNISWQARQGIRRDPLKEAR